MSIRMEDEYPDRSEPSSAEYPGGSYKNATTGIAFDGTPAEKAWANDNLGFFERLLVLTGITPSGLPDNALTSDRYNALLRLVAPHLCYVESSYVNGVYTVLPSSQGGTLSTYIDSMIARVNITSDYSDDPGVYPAKLKIGSLAEIPIKDIDGRIITQYRLLANVEYVFRYENGIFKFVSSSSGELPTLEIQHREASGTNGGAMGPGVYVVRPMTHVVKNTIPDCVVTVRPTNTIVFSKGIYDAYIQQDFCDITRLFSFLYNITTGTRELRSDSYYSDVTTGNVQINTRVLIKGRFTVTNDTHTFDIRAIGYGPGTAGAEMGANADITIGVDPIPELYTQAFFTKISGTPT